LAHEYAIRVNARSENAPLVTRSLFALYLESQLIKKLCQTLVDNVG